MKSWWRIARQTILPQFQYQREYDVESIDGVDNAPCWFIEVEWLAFHLEIAGGRFRAKGGAA